jgi:GNAT superfamily N-acetyltransferase
MAVVSIRPALPGESDALSGVCVRAKAHWGYDSAFMEKAAPQLRVDPQWIDDGLVLVAESDGALAGVAGLLEEDDGVFDVSVFFIEPAYMRTGVGRILFAALVEMARNRKARLLTILADPNAGPFYERMGAKMVGREKSETTGRLLPLLHLDLQ